MSTGSPVGPGRPYSLLCVEAGQTGQRRDRGAVPAYVALFLLGVMQGLVGCFQFSHTLAGVPVMSLAFCALILVTCVAGALGMGTALGGVLPALGRVIVTNTTAGKWYLYGGAACAATGIVASFGMRLRRPGADRQRGVDV